jgi:hypothetical protein
MPNAYFSGVFLLDTDHAGPFIGPLFGPRFKATFGPKGPFRRVAFPVRRECK